MRARFLAPLMPLALILSLSACNRSETPAPTASSDADPETLQAAPGNAGFVREAQAIKSREKDPARLEAAMRALVSRYGFPVRPEEGPVPPAEAPLRALGKAAATLRLAPVRNMNIIYHFAHSALVKVPANLLLEVTASQVDPGSDPMSLAFIQPLSGGAAAALVNFVAYNDDGVKGSLSSFFRWKNTTGGSRMVRIVSWSAPGTWGKTNLSYRLLENGVPVTKTVSKTMWVSGFMVPETLVPPPDWESCTGPTASYVELKPYHQLSSYGSSLVAFNGQTMRGAYLRDTDASLRLKEVLATDGPDFPRFLLGYFEGDGYQPDPMHTSEALANLHAHYQNPFYFGGQVDHYSCP